MTVLYFEAIELHVYVKYLNAFSDAVWIENKRFLWNATWKTLHDGRNFFNIVNGGESVYWEKGTLQGSNIFFVYAGKMLLHFVQNFI